MKRCVYLFLLSILLVAGLTACGSGKAEQEVPSLTEIEGMMKPLRPCPVFAARTFWTPGESRAAACPACSGTFMMPPPWAAG